MLGLSNFKFIRIFGVAIAVTMIADCNDCSVAKSRFAVQSAVTYVSYP